MSAFQGFDQSQGQPTGFSENGNGAAQGQQAQGMQQPGMMQQQPQGQPGQEGDNGAFQGQGGMEQGGMPGAPGAGDSKTTLWYVEPHVRNIQPSC